jgi:hypothetical protein
MWEPLRLTTLWAFTALLQGQLYLFLYEINSLFYCFYDSSLLSVTVFLSFVIRLVVRAGHNVSETGGEVPTQVGP